MTSAFATSNLEISNPLIEMISNNVCYLEVLQFRPFESDLEDAVMSNRIYITRQNIKQLKIIL
jgi:hypothetical protein